MSKMLLTIGLILCISLTACSVPTYRSEAIEADLKCKEFGGYKKYVVVWEDYTIGNITCNDGTVILKHVYKPAVEDLDGR